MIEIFYFLEQFYSIGWLHQQQQQQQINIRLRSFFSFSLHFKLNLTFVAVEILWKDVFSLTFTFSPTSIRTHILEFNSYALKKSDTLLGFFFFTDSLMRWTFFPLSLSFSYSSTSPIVVPSWFMLSAKKKRTRERANGSTTKSYIYTHTHALVWQTKRKRMNDLILVLHTYALSLFLYTFRNDEKSTEGNSLLIYSFEHRWFSSLADERKRKSVWFFFISTQISDNDKNKREIIIKNWEIGRTPG